MAGGVRKGAWTGEEDSLLRKCLQMYGEGKWHQVPLRAGLNRCRKSCRLRWLNYLRPNIKRGNFSLEEVDLIIRLHKLLGNRWSLIAGRLPGRTANDVKNYWNTHQIKKCNKAKTESDSSTIKLTIATTTPRIQVLKPRPRTFTRHNNDIITSFSPRDNISMPIITPNNNNNNNESIERIQSPENIITDETLPSSPLLENSSSMELFNSLFQNVDNEAGGIWPSHQLTVDEEQMMNIFFSEEIPSCLIEENNEGGDESNDKDKNKTLIWDNSTDNENAIDMDIWDLLGSS